MKKIFTFLFVLLLYASVNAQTDYCNTCTFVIDDCEIKFSDSKKNVQIFDCVVGYEQRGNFVHVKTKEGNTISLSKKLHSPPFVRNQDFVDYLNGLDCGGTEVNAPVTVIVENIPDTIIIADNDFDTVFVENQIEFPDTCNITGTVSVDNFPDTLNVSGVVTIDDTISVTGTVSVDNFPDTVNVSVLNFPDTIVVVDNDFDTVYLQNLPDTFDVSLYTDIEDVLICADGEQAVFRTMLHSDGFVTTEIRDETGIIAPSAWTYGTCDEPCQTVQLAVEQRIDVVTNTVLCSGSIPLQRIEIAGIGQSYQVTLNVNGTDQIQTFVLSNELQLESDVTNWLQAVAGGVWSVNFGSDQFGNVGSMSFSYSGVPNELTTFTIKQTDTISNGVTFQLTGCVEVEGPSTDCVEIQEIKERTCEGVETYRFVIEDGNGLLIPYLLQGELTNECPAEIPEIDTCAAYPKLMVVESKYDSYAVPALEIIEAGQVGSSSNQADGDYLAATTTGWTLRRSGANNGAYWLLIQMMNSYNQLNTQQTDMFALPIRKGNADGTVTNFWLVGYLNQLSLSGTVISYTHPTPQNYIISQAEDQQFFAAYDMQPAGDFGAVLGDMIPSGLVFDDNAEHLISLQGTATFSGNQGFFDPDNAFYFRAESTGVAAQDTCVAIQEIKEQQCDGSETYRFVIEDGFGLLVPYVLQGQMTNECAEPIAEIDTCASYPKLLAVEKQVDYIEGVAGLENVRFHDKSTWILGTDIAQSLSFANDLSYYPFDFHGYLMQSQTPMTIAPAITVSTPAEYAQVMIQFGFIDATGQLLTSSQWFMPLDSNLSSTGIFPNSNSGYPPVFTLTEAGQDECVDIQQIKEQQCDGSETYRFVVEDGFGLLVPYTLQGQLKANCPIVADNCDWEKMGEICYEQTCESSVSSNRFTTAPDVPEDLTGILITLDKLDGTQEILVNDPVTVYNWRDYFDGGRIEMLLQDIPYVFEYTYTYIADAGEDTEFELVLAICDDDSENVSVQFAGGDNTASYSTSTITTQQAGTALRCLTESGEVTTEIVLDESLNAVTDAVIIACPVIEPTPDTIPHPQPTSIVQCYGGGSSSSMYENEDNATDIGFSIGGAGTTLMKWEYNQQGPNDSGNEDFTNDILACIDSGQTAFIEVEGYNGIITTFEATGYVLNSPEFYVFSGQGVASGADKLKLARLSCGGSMSGQAFLCTECGEVGTWYDTKTGTVVDPSLLADCPAPADCPIDIIEVTQCAANDIPAAGVSAGDYVLYIATVDCEGVLIKSAYYTANGMTDITGQVEIGTCDVEATIVEINSCIKDTDGVEWSFKAIVAGGVTIEQIFINATTAEIGTPAGNPTEWTKCGQSVFVENLPIVSCAGGDGCAESPVAVTSAGGGLSAGVWGIKINGFTAADEAAIAACLDAGNYLTIETNLGTSVLGGAGMASWNWTNNTATSTLSVSMDYTQADPCMLYATSETFSGSYTSITLTCTESTGAGETTDAVNTINCNDDRRDDLQQQQVDLLQQILTASEVVKVADVNWDYCINGTIVKLVTFTDNSTKTYDPVSNTEVTGTLDCCTCPEPLPVTPPTTTQQRK